MKSTIINICLLALLLSCSSVKKIQQNTSDIQQLAQTTKEHFEKINEAAAATPPRIEEIKSRSDQGISATTDIVEKAKVVVAATSGVKDVVPWWADVFTAGAIAISCMAVGIILWQTGFGLVIKKLIGYIPESTKQTAKLLDESLTGDTSLRETVAHLRAKDPELDAAFKKRKKNAQLQTPSTTSS